MGFDRGDGSFGTANYWLVIPMVFCENGNVEIMRNSMVQALGLAKRSQYERFAEELAESYAQDENPEAVTLAEQPMDSQSPVFPNLDGVKFLTHGLGCGGREAFPMNCAGFWPVMPVIRALRESPFSVWVVNTLRSPSSKGKFPKDLPISRSLSWSSSSRNMLPKGK